MCVFQNLMVPEPNDAIPLRLQVCGTPVIIFNLQSMLTAIKFNDKSTFNAHEISNEGTYGVLPSELVPSQTPIPQMMPQKAFSIGLVLAQNRGFSLHSPLTLPSPLGGERG